MIKKLYEYGDLVSQLPTDLQSPQSRLEHAIQVSMLRLSIWLHTIDGGCMRAWALLMTIRSTSGLEWVLNTIHKYT